MTAQRIIINGNESGESLRGLRRERIRERRLRKASLLTGVILPVAELEQALAPTDTKDLPHIA